MTGKVQELNRENFAVRQHLRYVDQYAVPENYQDLTYEDTLMGREELAPLPQRTVMSYCPGSPVETALLSI